MADVGFFQGGAQPNDPNDQMKRQAMAAALMRQGAAPMQGQNVGGHYVAPTSGYAQQLVSALANGARRGQMPMGGSY